MPGYDAAAFGVDVARTKEAPLHEHGKESSSPPLPRSWRRAGLWTIVIATRWSASARCLDVALRV